MKVRLQSVSTLAIAVCALAVPSTGFAQSEEAPDSGGIQEIIVTAQKRDQNVQDVPVSITAFTSQNLQERNIVDVAALSALAPNVNLDGGTPFSGSSAILSATIRGIGSDDFAFNIDPGVGIYLDGVFLARTVGANQDLPDVERIEILKGPQGTLFGRNTIGGAISIVTHNPGDEFRVSGDVSTGSFNLLRARVTMDLPLTDGLGATVTAAVTNRTGFQRRIAYNGTPAEMRAIANSDSFLAFPHIDFSNSTRQSADSNVSMRGKLRWDKGGKFRATLAGDFTNQDTSGQNNSLLATPLVPNGPFVPSNPLPGTGINPRNPQNGSLFAGLYNFCIGSTPAQIAARGAGPICGARGTSQDPGRLLAPLASVNVDADPTNNRIPWDSRFITGDPDTTYATGPTVNILNAWGVAGTLDYDVTDNIMVKSITAFRKTDWTASVDADGSPLSILELTFSQNQEQFSQEVQLLGTDMLDGKLNWVLGAFYFEESGELNSNVVFNEGLLQAASRNTFDTSNYAFFGQVDYRLTDWIGFTVGGRYTSEDKAFEGGQRDLNGGSYKFFNCATPDGTINPTGNFPLAPPVSAGGPNCLTALAFPDPTDPTRLYPPGENRRKFSNFAPRVGVQVYPNDDIMVFANYSEGYKTGGWTTRLSNPQGNVAPTFDEEIAETWEAGFKSTLFDRRLQLNVAAFTTNYRNIQLNQQDGPSPVIDNAGTARIKGVEVEAVIAPVDGLTINTAVGYLDAQFTTLLPSVQRTSGAIPNFRAGAAIGSQLPKTANWSVNISPRYETTLGNGGSLIVLADWTHRTEVWNEVARYFSLRRPPTDIVNANITYREPEERWDLTVGVTNLTDQRFLISGAANDAAGAQYGAFNRPREWFVRMGFKF